MTLDEVKYCVDLVDNKKWMHTIDELHKINPNLRVGVLYSSHGATVASIKAEGLKGYTDQATYESVFDCDIKKDLVPVTLNTGKIELYEGWAEVTPAKVPLGLESYISKITLCKPDKFDDPIGAQG